MSDDVDPIDRAHQLMGGSFIDTSLQQMQNNMRKQLEQQQNQQTLGQMLQQQQKPGQK